MRGPPVCLCHQVLQIPLRNTAQCSWPGSYEPAETTRQSSFGGTGSRRWNVPRCVSSATSWEAFFNHSKRWVFFVLFCFILLFFY